MEAVEGSARTSGRTTLRLVASDNALPFYDVLGYTRLRGQRWEVEPGVVLPCTLMEKQTSDTRASHSA
jgi:hypothetical protein